MNNKEKGILLECLAILIDMIQRDLEALSDKVSEVLSP